MVRACETVADAWSKLAKAYTSPYASRIMGLAEQLTLLSRGNQPIAEYFSRVRGLSDELAMVGSPVAP